MKVIKWVLAISLFSYTAAGIALFFFQTSMIYLPDDRNLDDCNLPENVELWDFQGERGLLTDADNDKLLVFFHGNAGMACDWRFLGVNHLLPLGYDVLVVEYPGYGGDGRDPSKQLIEGTIEIANDWIGGQDYDAVSVMGYSLGTGTASIFAEHYSAEHVILFAPYDSIYNMAMAQGFVFPRAVLTEDFDNINSLAQVDAPIHILHGVLDQVVPANHSENLENMLRDAGRIVQREVLPDVGHQGLFANPFFDAYMKSILE